MLSKVFIIYLIIVLVYFQIHGVKNNKIEKLIFSICLPIFGLIITILSEVIIREDKNQKKVIVSTQKNKIERSKEFLTHIQSSVLDNLDIENYSKTREIILSIQSLPLRKQCEVCRITIWSKNVEISHISAVCLMRIKTYFEKLFVHMESYTDLNKIENIERYIHGLYNYLECKIVYGSLKENYINKLISLIKVLIEKNSECEEKYYYILIDKCVKMRRYEEAILYTNLLIEKYGIHEENSKHILNLYYETKDKNTFKEILENVKNIPNLTRETKNIVEFWEGEKIS